MRQRSSRHGGFGVGVVGVVRLCLSPVSGPSASSTSLTALLYLPTLIALWRSAATPTAQGNTCRRVGELTGHTASVTHLAIDERLNHVFSLSGDKVIKVGTFHIVSSF